jgi:hypothetical protein
MSQNENKISENKLNLSPIAGKASAGKGADRSSEKKSLNSLSANIPNTMQQIDSLTSFSGKKEKLDLEGSKGKGPKSPNTPRLSEKTQNIMNAHRGQISSSMPVDAPSIRESKRKFSEIQKEKEEVSRQADYLKSKVEAMFSKYPSCIDPDLSTGSDGMNGFNEEFSKLLETGDIEMLDRYIPRSKTKVGSAILEMGKFWGLAGLYSYMILSEGHTTNGYTLDHFINFFNAAFEWELDDPTPVVRSFIKHLGFYEREDIYAHILKNGHNDHTLRPENLMPSHLKYLLKKPQVVMQIELEKPDLIPLEFHSYLDKMKKEKEKIEEETLLRDSHAKLTEEQKDKEEVMKFAQPLVDIVNNLCEIYPGCVDPDKHGKNILDGFREGFEELLKSLDIKMHDAYLPKSASSVGEHILKMGKFWALAGCYAYLVLSENHTKPDGFTLKRFLEFFNLALDWDLDDPTPVIVNFVKHLGFYTKNEICSKIQDLSSQEISHDELKPADFKFLLKDPSKFIQVANNNPEIIPERFHSFKDDMEKEKEGESTTPKKSPAKTPKASSSKKKSSRKSDLDRKNISLRQSDMPASLEGERNNMIMGEAESKEVVIEEPTPKKMAIFNQVAKFNQKSYQIENIGHNFRGNRRSSSKRRSNQPSKRGNEQRSSSKKSSDQRSSSKKRPDSKKKNMRKKSTAKDRKAVNSDEEEENVVRGRSRISTSKEKPPTPRATKSKSRASYKSPQKPLNKALSKGKTSSTVNTKDYQSDKKHSRSRPEHKEESHIDKIKSKIGKIESKAKKEESNNKKGQNKKGKTEEKNGKESDEEEEEPTRTNRMKSKGAGKSKRVSSISGNSAKESEEEHHMVTRDKSKKNLNKTGKASKSQSRRGKSKK